MGGKPSRQTPRDMRLKANQQAVAQSKKPPVIKAKPIKATPK